MPLITTITHKTRGTCDIGDDCCPHARSGNNDEGTPLLEVEGRLVQLVGHHGPCNCPHGGTFASVEGSGLMDVRGVPVTLVGHATVCEKCGRRGTHIQGSGLLDVER